MKKEHFLRNEIQSIFDQFPQITQPLKAGSVAEVNDVVGEFRKLRFENGGVRRGVVNVRVRDPQRS